MIQRHSWMLFGFKRMLTWSIKDKHYLPIPSIRIAHIHNWQSCQREYPWLKANYGPYDLLVKGHGFGASLVLLYGGVVGLSLVCIPCCYADVPVPAEFPAFRAVTSWNVWNWNVDFTSSVWSGLQLNDALYKPANGWSNSALLPNRCWSPTLTTLDPEKASR